MQPDIIIFRGHHLYVLPVDASQGADRRTQPEFIASQRSVPPMIPCPQIIDHGAHLQNLFAGVCRGESLPRAVDRHPQPLDLDRLQKIIDCVRFERADREMIESGRKNDAGMPIRWESIEHIEACPVAHLDIK